MPFKGKLYIGGTAAAGFVAGATALLDTGSAAGFDVIFYLVLCTLFGLWKVRLPGLGSTISPNFLMIFIGIVQMPLPVTLAGLFAGLGVQLFAGTGKKPKAIQVIFNFSSLCLTAVASYGVFHGGRALLDSQPAFPMLMLLMASVYYILSTVQVSIVLCLAQGRPLKGFWESFHCWAFPYYVAGGGLAWLFCGASGSFDWRLTLCLVPAVYLVHRYFRGRVASMA